MTRLYRIAKNLAGKAVTRPAFAVSQQPMQIHFKEALPKTPLPAQRFEEPPQRSAFNSLKRSDSFGASSGFNSPRHKKRTRTTYEDNYSASISLPHTLRVLQNKHDDEDETLDLAKSQIVEHASRRVDLFFYTMIAYYNTGMHPTLGRTEIQHGRGRSLNRFANLTEACHSSLTPALEDELSQFKGRNHHANSILDGTHFNQSLNSTVELPPFVNELDDLLEEACRTKSIALLNQVAIGKLNPIEGLTAFLQLMHTSLEELKIRGISQQKNIGMRFFDPPKQPIRLDLLELTHKGTLAKSYSESTKLASEDYIQLMLRFTIKEKEACSSNPEMKNKLYADKIRAIQKEILESKSNFDPREYEHQMRG